MVSIIKLNYSFLMFQANARGYEVEILEPFTPWRWQPKRLAKCV